jgi:hypothetical protein
MNINTVNSATAVINPSTPAAPKKPETSASPSLNELKGDSLELKKSPMNAALKGGLIAAGAVGLPGLIYAGSSNGVEKVFALYLAGTGAAAAGVTGAVAGAVASQVTDSPWKGALVGVLTGAATGAAAGGMLGRSLNGAATGAAVGAVGGLIGGVAGTFASEKK